MTASERDRENARARALELYLLRDTKKSHKDQTVEMMAEILIEAKQALAAERASLPESMEKTLECIASGKSPNTADLRAKLALQDLRMWKAGAL